MAMAFMPGHIRHTSTQRTFICDVNACLQVPVPPAHELSKKPSHCGVKTSTSCIDDNQKDQPTPLQKHQHAKQNVQHQQLE
jgi:hypothetical protein